MLVSPSNQQVIVDLRKAQELRKLAIRRAPRIKVPVTVGHVVRASGEGVTTSDVTSID